MNKHVSLRDGLAALLAGCAAFPAAAVAQAPAMPQSAFYLGVGASARIADFGTQDVYAVGTSDVFRDGVRVSSGSADGPGTVGMGSETGVSPVVQLGYFQRFADSPWLWGANLNYTYMNASRTRSNARIPQAGTNTPVDTGIPEPFVGNAIVRSYQTELTHQVALMPFVGYAFDAGGFVYLGAGPTLSRMRTSLNGLVGFARPDGTPTDVSGAPQNFGTEGWVWGGAAMLGVTLFFDASWFLDVRYMLTLTERQTGNYSSTFTNPNAANGSVTSGTLVGSSSGRATTQGIVLTINRAF
ncbi:outer membrane beta-barrel protein [Roseomonas terrae]|jgi:hypothetical protein|uniref:Outer membrane beta-barrel protein n=1 Tax=Neoroseomonas terrae TaxID=424799 RepID=A0ABS5EBL6_9PROT|nr:outer membrane beta-barrel protein [Neoroseomonas terrae]MBR0648411.1 outer membrane beta-barrel protein [Neoroseomonas terrae]